MNNIRNVAIIAHVDHGKTTLVDAMLRQSGIFHNHAHIESRVLDRGDLERERGITILAKNTAFNYGDIRINVVDTPGHADFSGEVERILKMVNGVLLIVDAYDGPMPQTRFVLRKALERELVPIVIVNKIDRSDARPVDVVDMVLDLFIELGATDKQIDFPVLYASAREGVAFSELPDLPLSEDVLYRSSIRPLLDAIVETIPAPDGDPDGALQILISNIDYDSYLGRIAIGRIDRGTIRQGQDVVLASVLRDGVSHARIGKLLRFSGLNREAVSKASVGEIVCLAGIGECDIGDTVCDPDQIEPLPFVTIDEPTIAMTFSVNDSPFAGRDGEYVTSRHLRDRLQREVRTNIAMQMEATDTTEAFVIKGRGELHLSILIETMRREGYELQVSKPRVIVKDIDGELFEPEELVLIDVPEAFVGVVIEKLGRRKAELISMLPPERGYARLEFRMPSRGLIGYRSEFLTDTRGNGIISSMISGFVPWKGDIETRTHGVLVAHEQGDATAYGLYQAQERGTLFIGAGEPVYEGMIVGSAQRAEDLAVNVCRRKQLTNIRAAGSDEALRLSPPVEMSLEQCLEFISDDELIEITPRAIRLRKRVLDTGQRRRLASRAKEAK